MIYSDVDVCLMDDPLSSVDSHVGQHIFDHVIGPKGLLSTKTRIFVTHAVNHLTQVDEIIVLKDGKIAERGTYQELLKQRGPFSEYITNHANNVQDEASENDLASITSHKSIESIHEAVGTERKASLRKRNSLMKPENKQYEAEKMKSGKVGWRVYFYYIKNMGLLIFFSSLLFFFLFQVCSTASSFWLSIWSDKASIESRIVQKDPNIVSYYIFQHWVISY